MSFITTTIRYLVVVNCLISVGCAAHPFQFLGASNGVNGSMKRVVSSTIKPRFAQATHPIALRLLGENTGIFRNLCTHMFIQPVPIGRSGTQWVPYVKNNGNSFLQFVQSPSYPPSTEVQITSANVWSDVSMFHTSPSSDTGHDAFVYNLVMDPDCKLDRTIVFDSQATLRSDRIISVTQMGLGSDRLQSTKDQETKAWIEFLTKAHLKQDIPPKTPDDIAAAYRILELKSWSGESYTHYSDTLTRQKPLTQDELEEIIGIIDFCCLKQYPLATMVKYTGLPSEDIIRILRLLDN